MSETLAEFERVLAHCAEWDIQVRDELPPEDSIPLEVIVAGQVHYGDWHGVPLRGRIHWPTRTIYWKRGPLRPHHSWSLLHELAHTLQEELPCGIHETRTSMFGFEVCVGRYLGLSGDHEFLSALEREDDASPIRRNTHEELARSIEKAVAEGLLDAAHEPTRIRPIFLP